MQTFITFKKPYADGDERHPVSPGFSITLVANEDLDTASVNLTHLESKLKIQPYDLAFIYDDADTENPIAVMLVQSYDWALDRVHTPKYYSYNVKLVSLTKLLETKALPNITITQLKEDRRSVYNHIAELMDEYCPKKRANVGGTVKWKNRIALGSELDRLADAECPEMQWNEPTLREAIHGLMAVADCLERVVYRNGQLELSLFDLHQRGAELTNQQKAIIDGEMGSEEMDDYCTSLSLSIKNVTQSDEDGLDATASVSEQIGFRNDSEVYLRLPNNLKIETTMPIYEIERVVACFSFYDRATVGNQMSYSYEEADITDMVKESKVAATLPYFNFNEQYETGSDQWKTAVLTPRGMGMFQNKVLTYQRGSSTITGFATETQKNVWFIGQQPRFLVEDIIQICFSETYARNSLFKVDDGGESPIKTDTDPVSGTEYEYYSFSIEGGNGWTPGLNWNPMQSGSSSQGRDTYIKNLSFRVEYKTLASLAMKVGRTLPLKTEREAIDGQQSSYTDSYRFGSYEYSKVNRYGNEMRKVYGRTDGLNLALIPQIFQTYDGDVVYKTEVSYKLNSVLYTAYLTKQYVMRDYFRSVDSKIRSWAIAGAEEATERNDVLRCHAEFSYTKKTDTSNGLAFVASVSPSVLLSPIDKNKTDTSVKSINFCTASFNGGNELYEMPTVTLLIGNSIVSKTKAYDNFAISRYIGEYDSVGGGWKQMQYRYVDENGEATSIDLSYSHDSSKSDGAYNFPTFPFDVKVDGSGHPYPDDYLGADVAKATSIAWEKPLVESTGTALAYSSWEGLKDNRETLSITTQIEFCTDTEDIVFGREFLKRQSLVCDEPYLNSPIASVLPSNRIKALYSDKVFDFHDDLVANADPIEGGSVYNGVLSGLPKDISPFPTRPCYIMLAKGYLAECVAGRNSFYSSWKPSGADYAHYTIFDLVTELGNDNVYVKGDRAFTLQDHRFRELKQHGIKLYGIPKMPEIALCGYHIGLPNGAVELPNAISITTTGTSSRIAVSGSVAQHGAYCVADNQGNVLLAFRKSDPFYLNVTYGRDDSVYDSGAVYEVGSISN